MEAHHIIIDTVGWSVCVCVFYSRGWDDVETCGGGMCVV
jgi:hypothetical protein